MATFIVSYLRGRINIVDLLNSPMNLYHELYRVAFSNYKSDEESKEKKKENSENEDLDTPSSPSLGMEEMQEIIEEGG